MVKRFLSLVIASLMVLSYAAQAEESRAMGRYVESEVAVPAQVRGAVSDMSTWTDGRLSTLCATDEGYSTFVGGAEGWERVHNVAPKDEERFAEVVQRGEIAFLLYTQLNGDSLSQEMVRCEGGEEIPLALDFGGGSPYKMAIAADGTLLVQCTNAAILAFDPQTGEQLARFDGLDGAFTAQGDGVFAVSMGAKSVVKIDPRTGERILEMMDAPVTGDDLLAYDGESVYICNRNGIYRIAAGGTIWEQLVDGSLTSLSQPTLGLRYLAVRDGELYVLTYEDQAKNRLLRYRFDMSVTARPLYELNVCALEPSAMLSQLALRFQDQNPEYRVKITTLLAEGATTDDAIRALNTELLAGKGPDVLLVDGMPISDYTQKGVLADLSGLTDELTSSGELAENLMKPLSRDGKLFCVPTSCVLPVMAGKDEKLMQAETLDELLGLVSSSDAASPVSWRSRKGYFDMFLAGSFPAWFQADGQLNEAALMEYLSFIADLYQESHTDPTLPNQRDYLSYVEGEGENHESEFMIGSGSFLCDMRRLEDGRALVVPLELRSFRASMAPLTALSEMGGALAWLPGQAERAYIPKGMLGVNARSGQMEAALALVRMALSQDVQNVDVEVGLPVNLKSLATFVEDDDKLAHAGWGVFDPETQDEYFLSAMWPVRSMRERAAVLLAEAKTPYIPDATLTGMITGELEPFFAGEMDAQTASARVAAKVRAYLSE